MGRPNDMARGGGRALMKSWTLGVAPADIAYFKAAIESYDNLATLRTEDPARHHLRLWFACELEEEVGELVASLAKTLKVRIIGSRLAR